MCKKPSIILFVDFLCMKVTKIEKISEDIIKILTCLKLNPPTSEASNTYKENFYKLTKILPLKSKDTVQEFDNLITQDDKLKEAYVSLYWKTVSFHTKKKIKL